MGVVIIMQIFRVCLIVVLAAIIDGCARNSETEIDYAAVHEKLMADYSDLMSGYNDAILAARWQEKQRIDIACISLFENAVTDYPASPHHALYETILASTKETATQEQVDLDEFKDGLRTGSLSQLKLAFKLYTDTHNGVFPKELQDALSGGMQDYAFCPIHKVRYTYYRPAEELGAILAKYWTETEREGTYTITGEAPVLLECPQRENELTLRADLSVR